MKNITNAYLVLSVADIRNMLRAAELEQRVRGGIPSDREYICLQDITVLDDGQITSWSVMASVHNCITESNRDLHDAQQTACFNDSDAAI